MKSTLAEIREVLRLQAELLSQLSRLLEKLGAEEENGGGKEKEGLPLGEAARRLGVSYSTLRRLALSGEVRAVKVGKRWIIPAEELERLLG